MKFFSLFSSSPFYVVDSDLCWFHGDNQKQTDSGKCPEPSATWWRGLAGGYCHSGWLAAPRLATTRDRSGAPRAPPWPCVTPTLGAPPTHPIHRTHTRCFHPTWRAHVNTSLPGKILSIYNDFLKGIPSSNVLEISYPLHPEKEMLC